MTRSPTSATKSLAILLAISTAAAPVIAQPKPDTATADAEFEHGRKALAAGSVPEACAAFEASQKAEAAFGTQYNLAGCYVKLGKLATALALYQELAAHDTDAARKKVSAGRAKDLVPRVPKLHITTSAKPAGLTVTVDGVDRTAQVGGDVLVDFGVHEIVAKAPGYADVTQSSATSREAVVENVAITLTPTVVAKPVETTPVETTPVDATPIDTKPADQRPDESPISEPIAPEEPAHSHTRTIGYVVGGVGVAAVITGIVFWRKASSKYDDARAACQGMPCDSPALLAIAQSRTDDARDSARLSTIFTIAGAAAIGTGVILWLKGTPDDSAPRTALRPGAGSSTMGLTLEGSF